MKLLISINKFKEIFWLPLVLIHLFFLINTKFTLWPEMVVYPYLLNNHFSLYHDIITNYPPTFIYFLSFWSRVFGYQPINFQILTYLVIVFIDFLVFSIASKIYGRREALLGLLFFIIFSIPFAINGLWFDLIVTPFILASFYYFVVFFKKPRLINLFLSLGILTIGFFIKQQVIWVLIWFLIILSFKFRKRPKFIVPKIFISMIPMAALVVFFFFFFAQRNLLAEYIYWNFLFPFSIAAPGAGYNLLPGFRQILTIAALFILFLPILQKGKFTEKLTLFIAVILVAFAYRFDFFHLIPSLSILSLAAGINLKYLSKASRWLYFLLIPGLIVTTFCVRYIFLNWQQPIRFFEQNILTSAKLLEIVDWDNQPVYIQNGPDQLLPLAGRLPIKPWADEFPWYLERGGMQERIVSAMETHRPQFIVYKPYGNKGKYDLGSYRPAEIADYIDQNYINLTRINDNLWLKIKK